MQIGHANKSTSAKAVYGVMTILAVLDVMGDHPPVAWRAALILFGTTFAVALIDVYAESISLVLTNTGERPDLKELWHEVSPVLIGAQAPTMVMIASQLGLWSVERAITISQVLSFLILFGFGFRVGQTLHGTLLRQVLSGLVLVGVGALIVGIKVAAH